MDILYCVWNANRITNSKHGKIIPMVCKPNDEGGWFINVDKTIKFNSFTKYRDINLIPFLLTDKTAWYKKDGNLHRGNGNWIVYENSDDAIKKSNELLENKKYLMLGKIDRLKRENLSILDRNEDLF